MRNEEKKVTGIIYRGFKTILGPLGSKKVGKVQIVMPCSPRNQNYGSPNLTFFKSREIARSREIVFSLYFPHILAIFGDISKLCTTTTLKKMVILKIKIIKIDIVPIFGFFITKN